MNITLKMMETVNIPGTDDVLHEGYDISAALLFSTYASFIASGADHEIGKNFLGSPEIWEGDGSAYTNAVFKWDDDMKVSPRVNEMKSLDKKKIIMYQGLIDGVIPGGHTFSLYEKLKAKAGDSKIKYFEVPGMTHCVTGVSDSLPWYIGGSGMALVPGGGGLPYIPANRDDLLGPRNDALEALVRWANDESNEPKDLEAVSFKKGTWGSTYEIKERMTLTPRDKRQ
jgi:hypothetical protein